MKEKEIREGLNRLLKEQDSQKVGEVFDRMTGQNRSVPDRLWVLRERIKNLTEEAENLSSLLGYHSGSRFSQVIDLLNKAQDLTEETMSLTTNQGQSEGFRISEVEDCWEIWDDSVGVGIRFKKGEENSGRQMLFLRSEESLYSDDDITADLATDRVVDFAMLRFPREFGTEVH